MDEKDNRNFDYDDANDRATNMTEQEKIQQHLEEKGFTDQLKVEGGKLHNLTNKKKYKASEVEVVNFYRFEGISNPDDMSILYAIQTSDGSKGTLTDAFGLYSDEETGNFLKEVETHKKTD